MNIVDFSEGILGLDHPLPDGRQSRDIVARCLRKAAVDELPDVSLMMNTAANILESGRRLNINIVREIGEGRLNALKQMFYSS